MNNEYLTLTEYEINRILGKGTFSKVKLGINRISKEKVAIKIINKQFILNKSNSSHIRREIYILKKTSHPNIIKVHDIKEDSKNYYIIMEYCKYGELFQQIINSKHFDSNTASFYFFQLINGLNYLHNNRIFHRDLKPENLLIGENNLLKIIDFGLSNISPDNEFLNTPCGSPSYAPPEMIEGNKYDGELADIWSSGIVLYVMLSGNLPFDGKNNNDLFSKILKCKVHYPKNMDKTAVDLLKNLLVANPNKRFNLEKIKNHSFYLKGKKIFEEKYPELIDKIENANNINIGTKNSFIKNFEELEKSNKLDNDTINDIDESYDKKYKAYENQKEKIIISKYIQQNDNNNYNESKKDNNLYKSNLLLKTKNINYYKRILSDRLNIQKIRNSKDIINTKSKPNNKGNNTTKYLASKDKPNKNRNNINSSIYSTNKSESTNVTKTKDFKEKSKERSVQKSITIINKYTNDSFQKNHNLCKSPNHVIIRYLSNNITNADEEEKNDNEIIRVQKEKHNFSVNSTVKKMKKIYNNEIKDFFGDNIKNDLEVKNLHKNETPKIESIYVKKINFQMSPIKKMLSTFNPNIVKKKLEEINKNKYDNNSNKNHFSSKRLNNNNFETEDKNLLYKNKYLKIQSSKEIYLKKNECFLTEKNIINNINNFQFKENKFCSSQQEDTNDSIQIIKNNEKRKNIKNQNKKNKYMLASKLYILSTIKKNFNTCNDILNSAEGKEDFKQYIISHNKINKSKNKRKFINNINLKKNLNHSENKSIHRTKSNSIMLNKKEIKSNKIKRTISNNKSLNDKCKTNQYNNTNKTKDKNRIICNKDKPNFQNVNIEKRQSEKYISKEKNNRIRKRIGIK